MDKQDWYEMGSQIGDLVQSAIDNKNFRQLNQSIADTINTTVEMVQKSRAEGKTAYEQAMERSSVRRQHSGEGSRHGEKREQGQRTAGQVRSGTGAWAGVRTAGGYKGIALMGVGYSFFGVFGLAAGIFLSLTGVWDAFGAPALVFGLLALGFGWMGVRGSRLHARAKRQKRYLQIMGERDVCTLEELAAGIGKSRRYVARDLKRMIKDQMFADGAFLDEGGTCLMTSREAYRQYQETMSCCRKKKLEEERKRQDEAGEGTKDGARTQAELSREAQDILKEGREFIRHIRQCNDAVEDQVMSEKLERLEQVVTRIFHQVAEKPENAPDLHKMMSYYLPITRKLVDAYRDMDEQQVEGENIRRTKQEIEDSLDTINSAFETLLDGFFEDTAWDISSDISVLRTMMAQDGLMKGTFEAGRQKEKREKEDRGQEKENRYEQ